MTRLAGSSPMRNPSDASARPRRPCPLFYALCNEGSGCPPEPNILGVSGPGGDGGVFTSFSPTASRALQRVRVSMLRSLSRRPSRRRRSVLGIARRPMTVKTKTHCFFYGAQPRLSFPVAFPGGELRRSDLKAREVAFMQARQFLFRHLGEAGVLCHFGQIARLLADEI